MDESPTGCWTNHHSLIEFKNQWYLFYHHNDYSPKFDKARSVRADSLFFNADGTIQKVIPTLRGIGTTRANSAIQIDRYTALSDKGSAIDFIDPNHTFSGWKTIFSKAGAWAQYNSVDFGNKPPSHVTVNALSPNGGTLQIRSNGLNGPVVAVLAVPKSKEWKITKSATATLPTGIHNLFVVSMENKELSVDWIRFD